MKKIALLSDNHGYYSEEELWPYIEEADEVWHAGDIGNLDSISSFMKKKTFRAVYGNIDNLEIRSEFPLNQIFEVDGVKVLMTHIGGYPGRYKKRAYELLVSKKPDLFICGHSHILKVMKDKQLNHIHMNPGAYGHHGFHPIRTFLRFEILNGNISNVEVVELGRRGRVDK